MREAYYEREQVAQRDLGTTRISKVAATLFVGLFLIGIAVTPLIDARSLWNQLISFDPAEIKKNIPPNESSWERIWRANDYLASRGAALEEQMGTQLWPVSFFQPLQPALVRSIGLNTRSVIPGRNGWLYYKPDIDHLIGPGFMDASVDPPFNQPIDPIRALDSGSTRATDPIPAIIEFRDQLARRGIGLVIMPVPAKPAIHPESFVRGPSHHYADGIVEPLENRAMIRFREGLEQLGIPLLDPSSILLKIARAEDDKAYLKTDTHWTPIAVNQVAQHAAEWIETHGPQLTRKETYQHQSKTVEGWGDLAVILSGQTGSRWYPAEQVNIRQVMSVDGNPWQPVKSEILLLGDSFTNIFSMPELNFGEGAGLAEQLSLALQRPLDRIAQNNHGANATRRAFARTLGQQPQRFAQTKLVIWQFAARELSFGNWHSVVLPEPVLADPNESPMQSTPRERMRNEEQVAVRLIATGDLAAPGQVPYPDALLALEAVIESRDGPRDGRAGGRVEEERVMIYVWGKRDNRLLPSARWRAGQRVRLRLTPWEELEDRLGRFARAELDDPDFELLDLPVYFGELQE